MVARTVDTRADLKDHLTTERTYRVRAFFVGGSFSSTDATVTVTPALPPGATTKIVEDVDLDDAGGHDGTEFSSSNLQLTSTTLVGRYTAPATDATTEDDYVWIVEIDTKQEQTALPAVEPGTAEAMVTTSDGREPTKDRHGPDWSANLGTIPLTSSGQNLESTAVLEEVSDFTIALVEIRYNGPTLGGWTDWVPYRPRKVLSDEAQVRATLARSNLNWVRYVSRVRVEARTT